MPTYKTLYKGSYLNIETDINNANNQKRVDLYIYDTDSGSGSVETTIDLELTDEPSIFESIANEENKFNVVISKRADIKIYSSDSIKVETFSTGGDRRWYVEIEYDFVNKFKGWLSISDLEQDFLPDPNEILLAATDGLLMLGDIPLTDFNSANPTYEHRLIDYLAWILSKTGHQLNIVANFNIRSSTASRITTSPLTQMSSFIASGPTLSTVTTNFFYEGQTVTVSGTASNNVTFTVTGVTQSIVTFVASDTAFVDEPNVLATFTDITPVEDGHFFIHEWLFAKTFENDINTCIDCLSALKLILGNEGNIQQRNGDWYIGRVDEIEPSDYYLFTFDYLGNYVSNTTADLSKSVGADQLIGWMNDDCRKIMERAVKSVELDYPLETAKETLTNYDFSRGTTFSTVRIDPEGWKLEKQFPVLIEEAADRGFIQLELDSSGSEISRYLFIVQAVSNFYHAFRNLDRMYIHTGDKVNFSVDWRHTINEGGSGHYQLPVAMIRLWADDGTHWFAYMTAGTGSSSPQPYWIQSNAAWTTNTRFFYHEGDFAQDDLSQWQTASATSAPCPTDGRIEVFLVHNFKADTRGKAFSAISFEILPYIRGTYTKYRAHQFKLSQELDTVALIKEDVKMATTVKKYFKGALLRVTGTNALYTGNVTITGSSISLDLASGYSNYLFAVGKKITTSGTNSGYYTITAITYHVIGDNTELTVAETLTNQTASMTISEIVFGLSNEFYRANIYPSGPPDSSYYKEFGDIQIVDVWNQNNRTMAKFDGNLDHLDDETDIPDTSHKYTLTDADMSTTGKLFMPLHMRVDTHSVESNIFLHEVFDENIPKENPTPDFKYIT